MRIGINGSFWNKPSTGSGQYLRELLSALDWIAPGDAYTVIVPQAGATELDRVSPHLTIVREQVRMMRAGENIGKVWFEQVAFNRACARTHMTLAHVPYFGSALFSTVPAVVTVHDLIPLLLPAYRGSPMVRLYTTLASSSARRAAAVIADSECSRRDIIQHLRIPPARVHVVYLAADARHQPVEDIGSIRAKYRLPGKYLLYLGGFDRRKNVQVLIQAFARLPDLYRDGYRLVLGGVVLGRESAFFPAPDRLAREAGLPGDALVSLGWIEEEDKPALYSGATVFLYPSVYEGFGLPPLEAMACGTPVICSNASSLPEIAGDAAITLNPHDAGGWAAAIRMVATEPARREEMRSRGIAQAAHFSWERTARETLAVYRSVAG